jgi:ElaB/YqjD/DUF883 family membrane-anchored ribosome-binding protein
METGFMANDEAAKARKKAADAVADAAGKTADAANKTAVAVPGMVESAAAAVGSRFDDAVDNAKAGAESLKDGAIERVGAVTDSVKATAGELSEQAAAYAEQAKEKALELARQGKSQATGALAVLGDTIENNASTIDEKLGVQYGEYARGAARSIQTTAANLDAKDVEDIGADVVNFVRAKPAVAIGIAATVGFLISRLFRRSGSSDA